MSKLKSSCCYYRSKGLFPEGRKSEGGSSKRERKEGKSKPWKSHWCDPEAVDQGRPQEEGEGGVVEEGEVHPCPMGNEEGGDLREVAQQA